MYDPGYRGKDPIRRGEPNPYEAMIARGRDPGLDTADIRHLVALYDGEITYADGELGRFWQNLEKAGLAEDTLLVFTSDHGEEFYEHGGLKHGLAVYQESVHVPLVLRYPPILPRGVRVDRPFVQSLDLAPTILEIAGIESPPDFQGHSLLPLLDGAATEWRDHALTESPYSDAKAFRRGKWKYIHHFGLSLARRRLSPRFTSGTELYDLEADPEERHNVIERYPDVARELHGRLLERLPAVERHRLESHSKFDLDERARERLKALGYLD
jgi:arylsulfatase A-like enzyme